MLQKKEPTSGLYYKDFGNIRDPGYFQKPHTLKVGGGKGKGLSIIEKRCIFKDDFARIIYIVDNTYWLFLKYPQTKGSVNHARHLLSIRQYGLWSFQTEGTKLERFLPKNQHTQRKLLNFENWINGGLRSFQKSEF